MELKTRLELDILLIYGVILFIFILLKFEIDKKLNSPTDGCSVTIANQGEVKIDSKHDGAILILSCPKGYWDHINK